MLLRSLLALILLLTILKFRFKIPKNYFTSKITLIVLGILLTIFLATLFSPQGLNSIWGTYDRGLGLIQWLTFGTYFFLLLLYLNKKHIILGLKLLIFGTTLIAAYGILQNYSIDPIFAHFNTDFLEGRIFSTLGNPDFLAQLLAPVIALTLFFAWAKKKILHKIIYILPAIIMFIALLQTGSRASFLALILGILFFIFLRIKRKKHILIITGSLILLILVGIQLGLPTLDRFQLNSENFRSAESRLIIWDVAANTILDHPILGLGPDNFGIRFPEYMKPEFYYLEDNLHISADRAHNETLEMGLIGGFPLMLLYLALIALVLQHLIKNPKKKLSTALSLGLLIIFLQNQLTFSQVTHFVLTFYLLAGLIITTTPPKSFQWRPTKLFRYLGTPILIIFLLFIFAETVIHRVYAEGWYTYALATEDTKTGLQNAIAFAPLETEFRYDLLMWFPEERNEQLHALRQIEGESIDVLAWSANYMLSVDTEEAYTLFEEVIALNPLYPHTTRAYADGLYIDGKYATAAQYYETYLTLVPAFWTWCPDLESYSEYEQKKYRIFYKNVPDFNNSLIHLHDAYTQLGEAEKAAELYEYLECLNG